MGKKLWSIDSKNLLLCNRHQTGPQACLLIGQAELDPQVFAKGNPM
jgi:hypothetical protein